MVAPADSAVTTTVAAVLDDVTAQLAPEASGDEDVAQVLYSVAIPRVLSGTVYVAITCVPQGGEVGLEGVLRDVQAALASIAATTLYDDPPLCRLQCRSGWVHRP